MVLVPMGRPIAIQWDIPGSGRLEGAEAGYLAATFVPIVEVAFDKGLWWPIPVEISRALYQQFREEQEGTYEWNWGEDGRDGSFKGVNGNETTKINRYKIDFKCMMQTNMDNGRERAVRNVMVRSEDVGVPARTGLWQPKRARHA